MKEKTKYLFVFLFFALNVTVGNAQQLFAMLSAPKSYWYYDFRAKLNIIDPEIKQRRAREVMQDNELVYNTIGRDANFAANPLILNGYVLDYANFDLDSRGMLSVVKGNPESKDATAIPFFVSIRRDGQIVENKKMSFLNKQIYKVDLSDIFPFAKSGDVLIITPARVKDWKAKRILKLLFNGC